MRPAPKLAPALPLKVLLEIFLSLAILASYPMIKIIQTQISESELNEFVGKPYETLVKFVVDVENGILALGGEMHADAESVLLEKGSSQAHLWGGNYYFQKPKEEQIQYTSLINIRPSANNYTLDVVDKLIRNQIKLLVEKFLP